MYEPQMVTSTRCRGSIRLTRLAPDHVLVLFPWSFLVVGREAAFSVDRDSVGVALLLFQKLRIVRYP